MTDSFGDGWNANYLAIKQNNTLVGYFGNQFTSGSSSGPITIIVAGNMNVQVIAYSVGAYTRTN